MPSSLEIRLLGTFRVSVDGLPVPDSRWRQRKPALLLQRLAVEPHHRLHSEQLMEMLWPDADADASRNSLHKTIHMVRSALEPDLRRPADSHFLETRGQQLILTAPQSLWIDCEAFQAKAAEAMKGGEPAALEDALATYEGPLLPEQPYEEWLVERREHLQDVYKQLLAELARAYESRSDYDRAAGALQRLLAVESANEPAHRGLMRLYATTGRRQMALRQYRECSDTLRRELDTEPEPLTVEMYEQIVGGHVQREPDQAARLAILPFENHTGDLELDYVSDGMTESVIASLSALPRLHVMAHSMVERYRGADPRQVAQSLNVGGVVTGTIRQRQDRMFIRVELIDATGLRVWGAEYQRPQDSMIGLEEEISSAIAQQLGLTGTVGRRSTENAEAHRLFLRGRHHYNKRTLDSVTRSVDYFQRALQIDDEYALAWIGLADAYAKLGDVGVAAIPPKQAFSKAKIAAIRGVEIDTTLAEGHNSLAHLFMHEYEWSEAEREFRSALRLNPNDVTIHQFFAHERLMTGRRSEGFEEIARALELDPLFLPANNDYGDFLYFTRDYDAAIDQYQRTLELDPHFCPAHVSLGRCLTEVGRYDEALTSLETAKGLGGDRPEIIVAQARANGMSGNIGAARELLARVKRMAQSQYVSPYSIALVHTLLGETDEAFRWLRRACDENASWMIFVGIDPRVDPLRAQPAFARILERVGLAGVHAF